MDFEIGLEWLTGFDIPTGVVINLLSFTLLASMTLVSFSYRHSI